MAETNGNLTHTTSQKYRSTRGEDEDCSFEHVVMKGLASDGGLYIPEVIPQAKWQDWSQLSFVDLAFEIFSLYISEVEVPAKDLKALIASSYSTFRCADVAPTVHLHDQLYLLELFHGPTFAFKDVALQFLGNLFEYFLVRKNAEVVDETQRHHLAVIGATSGDTGSAAIYGLRGKKDVSVFILHPKGRISPIQEAQMTSVLDANVHNFAVDGTFDDCQDIVKALFADPATNARYHLGAVNSINWARILAQIVYYFYSYFSLVKTHGLQLSTKVRFAVPTGNFGNVLAGYFALRMGLPIDKLVIATNENDILDRFWNSGCYEKQAAAVAPADTKTPGGVKETLSPAMDILVSSNFERLLWFLYYEYASVAGLNEFWNCTQASQAVAGYQRELKGKGYFTVDAEIMDYARQDFESERVSDSETVDEIKRTYNSLNYVLDPHSAVGTAAARRSMTRSTAVHVALSTAHPAKFSAAVERALGDTPGFSFAESVTPAEFKGLEAKERRIRQVGNNWNEVAIALEEELVNEKRNEKGK